MAKKLTHLVLEQRDGIISCYKATDEDKELIFTYNAEVAKKADNIALANHLAELLHDCICLQNTTCELHDLNDTKMYFGTAFEYLE